MAHSLYHSSVAPFPAMARPAIGAATPAGSTHPNFVARRALAMALVLVALALVAGAFVLLAGLGGRPASASQAEPAISQTAAVYVAASGDTLWSIAQERHGEVGFERYLDTLIDLNGGTDVQIGQAVQLP